MLSLTPRPPARWPLSTRAVLPCLALALLCAANRAQNPGDRAEDPSAVVFVADQCGKSEGAPPAKNLGKLVLLTDLSAKDDYYEVVKLLQKAKKPAATIRYETGKIEGSAAELSQHLPEFVWIVTRPEHIEANQHFALLEMLTALDDDPFIDVAFGYLTGATAGEALAFARRVLARGKSKKPLPRTVLSFGPSANKTLSEGGPFPHELAKGWKKRWVYHGPVQEMLERAKLLTGQGVLAAGGHGEPDRIVDGLTGSDLRKHGLDLSPAIYFSGPCYCGVTGSWYKPERGEIREVGVHPLSSFALAALASGVTALFAGLDPDRGEQSAQELEHLWIHGDALGHAMKSTYDSTTVALRRARYELFRYEAGGRRPQKTLSMTMIGGAAGRALYGDPTYVPFESSAEKTFPVAIRDRNKALTVEWKSPGTPRGWSAVDVYRCGGRWTNRIAIREQIPVKTARKLKRFEVERLVSKAGPLPGRFPTAMIERWGGEAYLHIYMVFEPGGLPRGVEDLEARLVFAK